MKLDKTKGGLLNTGSAANVHFMDGTKAPVKSEAKYLGCMLNRNTNPALELKHRMAAVHHTWRKLRICWLKSACTIKTKLEIYLVLFYLFFFSGTIKETGLQVLNTPVTAKQDLIN